MILLDELPKLDSIYQLVYGILVLLVGFLANTVWRYKSERKKLELENKQKLDEKMIEKGIYDSMNKFTITDDDFNSLEKHGLFAQLNRLQTTDLPSIYSRSKQGLIQTLFVFFMAERFRVHETGLRNAIQAINKHRTATPKDVVNELATMIDNSKIQTDNHLIDLCNQYGIDKELILLYNHWYFTHWEWYREGLTDLLLEELDNGYYSLVNATLNHTRSFICAIKRSTKDSIDLFNGDATALVANLPKDFKLNYSEYGYKYLN